MKTLKISKSDAVNLSTALANLAKAKQANKAAEKLEAASKEIIARELQSLRGIDLNALPESETLIVSIDGNGGLKVDRRGRDGIDIAALRALQPAIANQFTKHTVASYFEVLA